MDLARLKPLIGIQNAFTTLFVFLFLLTTKGEAQITINSAQAATALAQKLVGTGVQISNATLTCPSNANGIFTVTPPSAFGLDSGIILTTGQANTVGATIGANTAYTLFATTDNQAAGDAQLTAIANQVTNDACVLEFDFIPAGDTIKFDYVFASEEYNGPHGNFNCSINDVFAFFISGPGITGSPNIALVPGTTVPVGVSTVNDAVGASPGNPCYTNTQGNGPYTQYYNSNAGSTTLTYTGFTDVFTAIHQVIPCNTYHLKLAIADASDWVFDSGVFLKAGSLTSNAISVTPVGGGGLSTPLPYCVRGCLPGQFIFNRPIAYGTPLTIHYLIQGSATNGTDYSFIADSVVIPSNQNSATVSIAGLPANPATGPKTVRLMVLSPYSCGAGAPLVIDSAEITIYDSLQVAILTADTAVCKYESVHIMTDGDSLLNFTWSPASAIDSVNGREPTVMPLQTTTYTLTATLPGSGCPASHDNITVIIREAPQVDAGPDTTTCLGQTIPFDLNVTPTTQTYTYTWSPGTYLNATNISNPVSTPAADVTYYIQVDPGAAGCLGYDTVSIHVLPNDISLFTKDTSICKGASVYIAADGDPAFNYRWRPDIWVSDSTLINPTITPDTSQLYTLTASFPGCPDIVKSLFIDVQPNPLVSMIETIEKCQWDTIRFDPSVEPSGYPFYTYSWTPSNGIDSPASQNVRFYGQTSVLPLTLTVATPAGCTGMDTVDVIVHQGNFARVAPADTGICPRDTVKLEASGALSYQWSPDHYLSHADSAITISYPVTNMTYTMIATDEYGCTDTLTSNIDVHPAGLFDLGETVTLYPGESVQLHASGNALYFHWFPPLGLSDTTIGDPIAQPPVNTRYFVTGITEYGCVAYDSVDVLVDPETLLDLPNAFSPTYQVNTEIKIIKRGIATLKYFRIFNRWGQKVFETTDIDEGWNGRFNGNLQPMGVYVYMIEAVTNTGRVFNKQGNITLIR